MSEQGVEIDLESGDILPEVVADTSTVGDNPELDENLANDSNNVAEEDPLPQGQDQELDEASNDTEREAIRERRRQERKHRKEAQREREDSLRRELQARDTQLSELRQQVDAINRRNHGSELAQLTNAKEQVARNYKHFKDQIAVATDAGDGRAVSEATERMFQAQRQFDALTQRENLLKERPQTEQTLDPRLINQAKAWMERNPWYNPMAPDQDSSVVMTLDQSLAREGWVPTTPEYWQELDSRIKKYLPHRAVRDKISNVKPRSVVTGSGRESASASGKNTFRVSPERVEALKEAGLWDDPKQRADAIKRYREHDKQNQG